MKLKSFQVKNFRCINDSSEVPVEGDVTCLVGKNESGKTAVLHALQMLKPDDEDAFDVTQDYPRMRLNTYRKVHEQSPATPISVTFDFSPDDLNALEDEFGYQTVSCLTFKAWRDYRNVFSTDIQVDESRFVTSFVDGISVPDGGTLQLLQGETTINGLVGKLNTLVSKLPNLGESLQKLRAVQKITLKKEVDDFIFDNLVPSLMYFGEYDVMCGSCRLQDLRLPNDDKPELKTLKALLELADISPDQLQPSSASYEDHKARLESTANIVTDEVFQYWSQNRDLEVELDVSVPGREDSCWDNNQYPWLYLRVKNRKHRVTVPFDNRSKGFVWFFSFFAKFMHIADQGKPVILLLDEPGLSLHASAQADFLRLINERLAPKHQVIYTTHSPFMVEPDRLNRVRLVEDMDKIGTTVSSDALRVDSATSFPLQAALGYSMAQSLFVGPNCLLVEGASDLLYLQVMSDIVQRDGLPGLDPKWVIVPVGGADRLAAFATLLGANKINVVTLMDLGSREEQKIKLLVEKHILDRGRILNVGEFLDSGATAADIEDLFDPEIYLQFVNKAFKVSKPITVDSLPPGARITKRVKTALESMGINASNHYRAAELAARELPSADIPSETLRRFSKLFERINEFVKSSGGDRDETSRN